MARVGLILAGCGFEDGSDVREALLLMLALERDGADCIYLSLQEQQDVVFNHYEGRVSDKEFRNIIFESARLVRGKIREISGIGMADLDALIIPGGLGVLHNFSDFAKRGAECSLHPEVERIIREAFKSQKPIGAVSHGSVLVAAAFRDAKNVQVKLTCGDDRRMIDEIRRMGAVHQECDVRGICMDFPNRILTTPGSLVSDRITDMAAGIDRLTEEILAMI